MKNAAGILLVIYLFFLVPLLAGALIDAAAGVKKRNISSTYANGFVAMLVCSSLELIGKVIFAIWVVPAYGYFAVCLCEPVTWVVCCIFVLICAFLCRKELR